ncbi:MAG: hypothetical protein QOH20_3696 [Mycobacterium sp.]|nr:hypothetical protein [Mycobacterium sp.]
MHAICQLVNEVLHDERVAVAAVDLEYALHNVAPAEQQLAFALGQVRATGHKSLNHSLSVAQLVLQHEVVERVPPRRRRIDRGSGPRSASRRAASEAGSSGLS